MHPHITEERLKALPLSPGVYLIKDEDGRVVYVGKAKELRTRVRNYFNGQDTRPSVTHLLKRVRSIDTIITIDERQALVLEADLIRKYKPKYNIRLKDDKAYLLVRVDLKAQWPRLELTRNVQEDGATYLGPFAFGYELRTLLEIIKRILPLRTCADTVMKNRVRPCLEYQIKKCLAPCTEKVEREYYLSLIRQAMDILRGKTQAVAADLEHQMLIASEELRFEDAALLRDRVQVLRDIRKEKGQVVYQAASADAWAVYREGSRVEVSLLMVRRGRLFEARSFSFEEMLDDEAELLSSVISQFYSLGSDIPEEILLPWTFPDWELLQSVLIERRGAVVRFQQPKIGAKARLIELATVNARENFQANLVGSNRSELVCRALARELQLEDTPRVMECVDISHFQGGETVASVVSFLDGRPNKNSYRRFTLSQEGKPDDFASMHEVIKRHLTRGAEENTLPDLLVIDGGPAQLAEGIAVKKELGLCIPLMIGLAKKRTKGAPYLYTLDDEPIVKPERIYFEKTSRPLILNPNSDALHLLERIRNEAHRFAISFHRSRRSKRVFKTALDNIPGIGEKRAKLLLRQFGSIKGIMQTTPEEISSRCKLPLKLAERLLEVLRLRRASNS